MGKYLDICREFIQQKRLSGYTQPQTKQEPVTYESYGMVIKLHKQRPTCHKAGRCLVYTSESDCELYYVRPGWCRERVKSR